MNSKVSYSLIILSEDLFWMREEYKSLDKCFAYRSFMMWGIESRILFLKLKWNKRFFFFLFYRLQQKYEETINSQFFHIIFDKDIELMTSENKMNTVQISLRDLGLRKR